MKTLLKTQLKALARDWLPPRLGRQVARLRGIRYRGPYPDWASARAASRGYDSALILERSLEAALMVRRGEAAFERDAIAFAEPETPFALVAALLLAAGVRPGPLVVLDFGGGLGSAFPPCQPYLQHLPAVRWGVVEQAAHVRVGAAHLADDRLGFFASVQAAVAAHGAPSIVVVSSVLPYLADHVGVLDELLAQDAPVFFVDRTVFAEDDVERVFVQQVPARVYPASYPVRFLSRTAFLRRVSARYRLIEDFASWEGRVGSGGYRAQYRGSVWLKP